jgi:hypothetical protein
MEDGLQHMDDECALKEKCEEITHDTKWLYEWVVCNNKRHDVYDENQLLQAVNKACFLKNVVILENHVSIKIDHLQT